MVTQYEKGILILDTRMKRMKKMPGSNPRPTQQGLGTWTKYTVVALLANLLLKEVSTSSELI